MFNLTIKPIIYTYQLGEYLAFLSDIFDTTTINTSELEAEISLLGQTFLVQETPKKRTKLPLNFQLTLHLQSDLETILERAEFYYYRKGLKLEPAIQKMGVARYKLVLTDPDKRTLEITCSPRPQGRSNISSHISYN